MYNSTVENYLEVINGPVLHNYGQAGCFTTEKQKINQICSVCNVHALIFCNSILHLAIAIIKSS